MNRIIILLISVLFAISATGCDSGLEIVGIEIEKYPDKIVYCSGIDKELDLTGGVVNLILKQKTKTAVSMAGDEINVIHNIDFNKPGVYVVELERNNAVCKFPIQVIDKNALLSEQSK